MTKPVHIGDIERIVYNQLEASKKLFQAILALTKVARQVSEEHQPALGRITEELLEIGNQLSDDAQATGAKLLRVLAEELEQTESTEPTQENSREEVSEHDERQADKTLPTSAEK